MFGVYIYFVLLPIEAGRPVYSEFERRESVGRVVGGEELVVGLGGVFFEV